MFPGTSCCESLSVLKDTLENVYAIFQDTSEDFYVNEFLNLLRDAFEMFLLLSKELPRIFMLTNFLLRLKMFLRIFMLPKTLLFPKCLNNVYNTFLPLVFLSLDL